MPDAAVDAARLKAEFRAAWKRYVAAHIAARDTLAAAIVQLSGRHAATTNPTRRAGLRTKRTALIERLDLVELMFAAANAGQGRVKAPTQEEVDEHKQRAAEIAARTADNMTASAIVQSATRAANLFSQLHLNP